VHDGGQAIVARLGEQQKRNAGGRVECRITRKTPCAPGGYHAGPARAPVTRAIHLRWQRAMPDTWRHQHRSADPRGLGKAFGRPGPNGVAYRRDDRVAVCTRGLRRDARKVRRALAEKHPKGLEHFSVRRDQYPKLDVHKRLAGVASGWRGVRLEPVQPENTLGLVSA
jgi:hypothetical protein